MLLGVLRKPLNQTATLHRFSFPSLSRSGVSSPASSRWFSEGSVTTDSPVTRFSELPRVPKLVEGCDYEHWLVVMEAPRGYPLRDDIVSGYIKTLAMALGSDEEAKKSIYSVSTKYYYAFGCKVRESLTEKIKYLPDVKWVLPDSYLCYGEDSYGGEPFIDGEVVPYDGMYHADWVRDEKDDKYKSTTHSRKARKKRKKIQWYSSPPKMKLRKLISGHH